MNTMKRAVWPLGMAMLLLTALTTYRAATAQGAEKKAAAAAAKEVTIKGEVVDMACYMESGARGEGHKACAKTCILAGNPVGLVDAQGRVFLLIDKDHHTGAADQNWAEKAAQTVTVTGKLVKKGGVEAIYVASVK